MNPKLSSQKVKKYVSAVVLGAGVGVAIGLLQPHWWEGEALVSIGQLHADTNGLRLIEDTQTVVERIKSPSFMRSVAERVAGSEAGTVRRPLEIAVSVRSIRSPVPTTIAISVSAGSAEAAKSGADAVVAELLSRHNAILAESQASTRSQLSKLDGEIDSISKLVSAGPRRPDASTLLARALLQNDLAMLINRVAALRDTISSMNMWPSRLLEPVSVSERRVFSQHWRAWLLGALVGLFAAIVRDRWKRE